MIWWPRATGHEVTKNYWARHDQEVFRFSISGRVIWNSKKHNSRFDVEESPRITLLHNCETTVLLFTCRYDSQTWWLKAAGHEVIKNYWTRYDQESFRFNISARVIWNSKKRNSRFDVEESPRITLLHSYETLNGFVIYLQTWLTDMMTQGYKTRSY